MLARMEPIAAVVDETVLPFKWPPVAKKLSPPIVAMEKVSAGYGDRVVLSRLDLTLSNDDRVGLLGANGNGKSTFAKLIGGRLPPMGGKMVRAEKLEAGFFAQHQVDDLEPGGTPYSHVAERMRGEPESKIRGRAALIGFSGGRADTKIEALSGGEKARLLMGLATFDGPQLLILDEPTNHLDIDSRAELIEAINDLRGRLHHRLARPPAARGLRRPAVAGGQRHGEAVRRRRRRLRPLRPRPGRARPQEEAAARRSRPPPPRTASATRAR